MSKSKFSFGVGVGVVVGIELVVGVCALNFNQKKPLFQIYISQRTNQILKPLKDVDPALGLFQIISITKLYPHGNSLIYRSIRYYDFFRKIEIPKPSKGIAQTSRIITKFIIPP